MTTDMRDRSAGRGRTTGRTRRGQPFRGVFSGLLLVLAVCALALCGYETASGRWHATPVLSGSMRPGLQPGDVVVTQRVPVSDLHVRDVIVFHPPNEADRQTVHRIVKLRVKNGATVITTRGDANTIDDPTVTSLRGTSAYRVTRVVPVIGYPAVWLSGGHHGVLAIGLGILLLIVAAVTLLRPEVPRKERRQDESEDDRDDGDPGKVVVPAPSAEAGPSSTTRALALVGHVRHVRDVGAEHATSGGREQNEHEPTP
jgi:signal peptidase I